MIENLKLKIKSLPPFSKTFQDIKDILDNEDSTIEELAKAIEKDPMLTADFLKTANSPLYGANRQIKSLVQAVSLFGFVTAKSLVLSSSIKRLLKVDIEPYGITPDDFVKASNMQGALAKIWFNKINPKKMNDLFICALLQEIGKILISDEVIKNNDGVDFRADLQMSFDIASVERSYVKTTTALVTAEIFDYWGFEKTMVENIRNSYEPANSPFEYKEIAWALKIIRKAIPVNDPLSDRSISIALNLAKEGGFDEQILLECIEKIKKSSNENSNDN